MSSRYYHGVLNDVDDKGNVRILYPKTYASDVKMDDGNSLQLTVEDIYSKKQDKTDNSLNTTSKAVVGAINELLDNKQNKTDNSLNTTNKTIVGSINELVTTCGSLDSNKQNKTDNSLNTTSKNIVGSINELVTTCGSLDTNKQNKTDNSLNTTSKNIVGSINEVLTKTNGKVKVNSSNVSSINFSLSGTTLTITTS